jgi:hypothetical protein
MAAVTQNGTRRSGTTLTQLRKWVESLEGPITSGNAMERFNLGRHAAKSQLTTLVEEGLLVRTGTGAGTKYEPVRSGAGPTPTPQTPAWKPGESDFLDRLASDCDRELARLDGEIAAIEAAREELTTQQEKLARERTNVEAAKAAVTN